MFACVCLYVCVMSVCLSHIVSRQPEGPKYEHAIKWNIPVVNLQYLNFFFFFIVFLILLVFFALSFF